jgi:DNA modification methylase
LPEAVYYISELTKPGDLVIDPFAGSGTAIVACRALGRRVIGAEIDPKVYEMASTRLACKDEAARAAALVRELHSEIEVDLDADRRLVWPAVAGG